MEDIERPLNADEENSVATLPAIGLLAVLLIVTTGEFSLPVFAAAEDELLVELDQRVNKLSTAGLSRAVRLAERDVALLKKSNQQDNYAYAQSITWLARLYQAQGRYSKAEPYFVAAFQITEKVRNDPGNIDVARGLNRLAWLYREQGRYTEALPLFRRVQVIVASARSPQHPDVAETLSGLAWLYKALGGEAEPGSALRRYWYDEAIKLMEKAIPLTEKALGYQYPTLEKTTIANQLLILVEVYRLNDRVAEAEPLALRALSIYRESQHPLIANALNELALVYRMQNRYVEAEPLFLKSVEINEKRLGPEHLDVGRDFYNLAFVYDKLGNTSKSLFFARKAAELVANRSRRMANMSAETTQHQIQVELADQAYVFHRLIRSAWKRAQVQKSQYDALASEAFLAAQWSRQTSTSSAVAQLMARLSQSDPRLNDLVRDRQDLAMEWELLNRDLISAASETPNMRNSKLEQEWHHKRDEIGVRLKDRNDKLKSQFKNYYELANSEPISITAVKRDLLANEALVQFIFYTSEVYAWVITKTQSKWILIADGGKTIPDQVAALRCGLDQRGEWTNGDKAKRCQELLGVGLKQGSNTDRALGLPFNLSIAYDLYQTLFGQFEDLIKSKNLLLVPSGPLLSFPFHVLVTERPILHIPHVGYGDAAWLVRNHAVTTLASVASLQTRRQIDKSTARQSYLAFGNPLLVGVKGNDRRAWLKQTCDVSLPFKVAARGLEIFQNTFAKRGLETIQKADSLFSRGFANVDLVRLQPALPETADELCRVAHSVGAKDDDVYLGSRATETEIRGLNANGKLRHARIVHFATHGLLAGEAQTFSKSLTEPALILTPPEKASKEDDGLLTSSEVARLTLDADWVILSACNTAAGENQNAEALSGLGRAFFYAGARALLVSYWYVDSEATVALITTTFSQFSRYPEISRAEALQKSMLSLIEGNGHTSHPAKWGAFMVVGDGSFLTQSG